VLHYSQKANSADAIIRDIDEVIAQGTTGFQSYMFLRSAVHGVCIALDGDIQSCEADEALYHEALVHPALLLHPEPKSVLIMRGGEGATSREALRHAGVERVVMVDIDREFVELCKTHIPAWSAGAYADPRHELRYEDINAFLAQGDARFDVVIGDLVDFANDESPAAIFYSPEFYARLKSRLNAGGLIATQAGPLSPATMDHHNAVRQGLRNAFGAVQSYGAIVPSFYGLWSFAVAGAGLADQSAAEISELILRRGAERGVAPPATGLDALANTFRIPTLIAAKVCP
jgi:spermidine synthase